MKKVEETDATMSTNHTFTLTLSNRYSNIKKAKCRSRIYLSNSHSIYCKNDDLHHLSIIIIFKFHILKNSPI